MALLEGGRIFRVFHLTEDSIALLLFYLVVLAIPDGLSFFDWSVSAQLRDKLVVSTLTGALALKADGFLCSFWAVIFLA